MKLQQCHPPSALLFGKYMQCAGSSCPFLVDGSARGACKGCTMFTIPWRIGTRRARAGRWAQATATAPYLWMTPRRRSRQRYWRHHSHKHAWILAHRPIMGLVVAAHAWILAHRPIMGLEVAALSSLPHLLSILLASLCLLMPLWHTAQGVLVLRCALLLTVTPGPVLPPTCCMHAVCTARRSTSLHFQGAAWLSRNTEKRVPI